MWQKAPPAARFWPSRRGRSRRLRSGSGASAYTTGPVDWLRPTAYRSSDPPPSGGLSMTVITTPLPWPVDRVLPDLGPPLPDGTHVVSVDGHWLEPPDWVDRFPAKFR